MHHEGGRDSCRLLICACTVLWTLLLSHPTFRRDRTFFALLPADRTNLVLSRALRTSHTPSRFLHFVYPTYRPHTFCAPPRLPLNICVVAACRLPPHRPPRPPPNPSTAATAHFLCFSPPTAQILCWPGLYERVALLRISCTSSIPRADRTLFVLFPADRSTFVLSPLAAFRHTDRRVHRRTQVPPRPHTFCAPPRRPLNICAVDACRLPPH